MTEEKKKQYQRKVGIMSTDALLELAHKHSLNVRQVNGQAQIVGPNGYISDTLHGEKLHDDKDFEPGNGTEADWEALIAKGPLLAYVHHAGGDESFSFADNFFPADEEEVSDLFANLRISSK